MVINEEGFAAAAAAIRGVDVSGGVLPEVIRNQLNEPTTDGQPDENARANCVMASFAAAMTEETGQVWYGDTIKDAVYGQAYHGGTNPEVVAPHVASLTHGKATSWVIKGSPAQLLAAIKAQIDLGHPVIIEIPSRASDHTNPSQKVTIPSGNQLQPGVSTHANCVFGYRNGNLVVMDPWTGWIHEAPESWWESQLVYGRVEPVASEGTAMSTPLDGFFNISSDGKTYTLKSDSSISMTGGELDLFQKLGGCIGLPVEPHNYHLQTKFYSGFAFRRFERGIIVYDPQHKKDAQPAMGDFYLGHIDDPDFDVQGLAAVKAQLDAAQQAASEAQAADKSAQDALAVAQAQIADLGKQLAAAQANQGDPAQVQALKDALAKCSALLAPFADAAAEVKAVLA